MSTAGVCPVVGTTNNVLPPTHPTVDLDKPGQTCPVTNATTDHHHNLAKHPAVPGVKANDASSCPALKDIISQPTAQKLDDQVCPVVGAVTTVLPPDHPDTKDAAEGAKCPVTNATIKHHVGKVHQHPSVQGAQAGAVCPVVGARA